MYSEQCFLLITSRIGNHRSFLRAAKVQVTVCHDRMLFSECDQFLIKTKDGRIICHLAGGVDLFIVGIDTEPWCMVGKSTVCAVIPLHRCPGIISADALGFCESFLWCDFLFNHGMVGISGIDIVIVFDGRICNICHTQFLALINKRSSRERMKVSCQHFCGCFPVSRIISIEGNLAWFIVVT